MHQKSVSTWNFKARQAHKRSLRGERLLWWLLDSIKSYYLTEQYRIPSSIGGYNWYYLTGWTPRFANFCVVLAKILFACKCDKDVQLTHTEIHPMQVPRYIQSTSDWDKLPYGYIFVLRKMSKVRLYSCSHTGRESLCTYHTHYGVAGFVVVRGIGCWHRIRCRKYSRHRDLTWCMNR